MRKLRDKAPETARFLATTILKHSDVDNGSQDEIECQRQDSAKLDDNAIRSTKRKSARTKDLSYRPPRSAKAKAEKSKYSNFQVKISTAPFFSVSTLCSTSLLRRKLIHLPRPHGSEIHNHRFYSLRAVLKWQRYTVSLGSRRRSLTLFE
jgi:hypothetical protein